MARAAAAFGYLVAAFTPIALVKIISARVLGPCGIWTAFHCASGYVCFIKFPIQPPSVVIATNFLPMASPHQLAPTSSGLTREPSLYISLTSVAIVLTSGVSRVAVL